MGNPVVHFEIGCKDKAATSAFYAKMFDWKIDDGPAGMIDTGSKEGIQGMWRRWDMNRTVHALLCAGR